MSIRAENEIQAAHDRLAAMVLGEIENPFEPPLDPESRGLTVVLDVLCWVLRHDHNNSFEDVLKKIDDFMAERGYVLRRDDA